MEKPTKKAKKTQKKRKFPTLRQEKAFMLFLENLRKKDGKKKTLGEIMREAGYSEGTARQPITVMRGQGWQTLMEKYLPDKLLVKTHKELLGAAVMTTYRFPTSMSDDEIKKVVKKMKGHKLIRVSRVEGAKVAYVQAPDNQSRLRAIAEAYRIRNKYPAEKHKIEGKIEKVEIVRYAEPDND